jgi:hypothetical protein
MYGNGRIVITSTITINLATIATTTMELLLKLTPSEEVGLRN